MKIKKCRVCKEPFEPQRPLQSVCGFDCAKVLGQAKSAANDKEHAKANRATLKAAKLAIKPLSYWHTRAQVAFNKFIRMRDHDQPCISCGRNEFEVEWQPGGLWDCGHFMSVGHAPELRFEEKNAYKQCKKCNGGSGKYAKKNKSVAASYEENLRQRVGNETVDWLKGAHEPKHYKIPDLQEIEQKYLKLAKELESELFSNEEEIK
jgi:hypothetical protein